jgi:hypothetical protein
MTAPEFPRRVSVAEVAHNARCELYAAVQERGQQYPWLKEWAAAFDFSFVVDRDANATTDTAYLLPIHFGTFGLGLKANLKQKAKGTYTVSYKLLKGLGKGSEAHCGADYSAAFASHRLLSGEIGLQRWVNDVVPQLEAAQIQNATSRESKESRGRRAATGEVTGVGYTIEFGITADGTLLPSWALAYPDKRQFKPGFGVTLSEAVTHKLVVAMTPIPLQTDPKDKSGVSAIEDGKEVIIARRVCIIDNPKSNQCKFEEDRAASEAAEKARLAKKDSVEKKQTEDKTKREVQLLETMLPAQVKTELRNVPKSRLPNLSESEVQTMTLALPADEKDLFNKYLDAQARAAEAAKQRKDADEAYRQAEKERRLRQEENRAAADAGRARARAEAESEASRRLDQLIQQQLLRDALRP